MSAGALVLLAAAGCVAPIPVYERPPFWSEPGGLHFIAVGRTHKSEVAASLGAPDLQRADGRVWVYAEGQTRGMVFGNAGNGPLIAEHLLVIAFDSANVVAARTAFQDTRGCLLSGVCFASHWRADESAQQLGMEAKHDALPIAMDFYMISARIDPFEAPADTCRLLLYASPDAGRGLLRLLDPDRSEELRRWTLSPPYVIEDEVPPGRYWLTLSLPQPGGADSWPDVAGEPVAVDCIAGQTRVARHTVDSGFWTGLTGRRLELIPIEAARADIRQSVLVRQPSDPEWQTVMGYQGEPP